MSDFIAQGLFIVGVCVGFGTAGLWALNQIGKDLRDHLEKMNDIPF